MLLSAGNNRSEPGVAVIPHLFNFSVQPVSSVSGPERGQFAKWVAENSLNVFDNPRSCYPLALKHRIDELESVLQALPFWNKTPDKR